MTAEVMREESMYGTERKRRLGYVCIYRKVKLGEEGRERELERGEISSEGSGK